MGLRWKVGGVLLVLGAAGALAAGARERTAGDPPGEHRSAAPLQRHPVVALTFDDMPAAGGLAAGETRTGIIGTLAGELQAHHLQGTYGFVTAADLDGDPDAQEAVRLWVRAGMNIGNHTWSHPSLTSDSAADYEHQIALDEPALREYAEGRDWHWFRYPYLEEGDTVDKRNEVQTWLRGHGYRIAEATLNFEDDDWSDPYDRCLAQHDAAGIAWLQQSYMQNAAEFIRVGRREEQTAFGHQIPNVLLLHATAFTTLMLPRLLHLLDEEGFRFAPLERVEANRAYAVDPEIGLPGGGPLTNQILIARHLPFPRFRPEPVERLDRLCR